jgi:hypothetical protein
MRNLLAGSLTAIATGGFMALLVMIAGARVSSFTEAILALTIPLLVAGVLFGWLTATERLAFMSAILYWAAGFPAARLTQHLLVGEGALKDGLIGFVIYQAIVGVVFGLGFLLLYQHVLAGIEKVLGHSAPAAGPMPHDGPAPFDGAGPV